MNKPNTEFIPCPYCQSTSYTLWATENGFSAVKCKNCSLVYVNPRPVLSMIENAVKTGVHGEEANSINVISRRIGSKVSQYRKVFSTMFSDIWETQKAVSWLDIGAGYGEIIESVSLIAPKNSIIKGLEPMHPKAEKARARGLIIIEGYIDSITEKFDIISLIDIFSHIPDFRSFLKEAKEVLNKNGEIFIETGNTAEFNRNAIPGELSLPDHLVFASEYHIIGFLEEAGFEIVEIKKVRIDTLIWFLKDLIKFLIGRPIKVILPYTSPYRSLLIRARIKS